MYHIDPEVITEITDWLRDHHACDDGVLHELLRTPKMQELLRASRRSKSGARGNAVTSVRKQRLPTGITRYLAQYDRTHLYRQVWSAPMSKIGKHYGVTGVEIAK